MTDSTDKLTRVLALPTEEKRKLRLRAASSGTTLANDVADLIRAYADGKYDGDEGRINIATVDDPGPQDTDGRVKFRIEEAVWDQARIRAIIDETTLASAIRRIAVAVTAD